MDDQPELLQFNQETGIEKKIIRKWENRESVSSLAQLREPRD